MAADLAAFRAAFPEITAQKASDAEVERHLALALEIHSHSESATLHCAAHLVAISEERTGDGAGAADGGSGVVTSESLGPKTVTYLTNAGASARKAFFATSPYGRMFLTLEGRSARPAIAAMVV